MIGYVLFLLFPQFLICDKIDYDPLNERLECYSCDSAEYESECQIKLKCLLGQVREMFWNFPQICVNLRQHSIKFPKNIKTLVLLCRCVSVEPITMSVTEWILVKGIWWIKAALGTLQPDDCTCVNRTWNHVRNTCAERVCVIIRQAVGVAVFLMRQYFLRCLVYSILLLWLK